MTNEYTTKGLSNAQSEALLSGIAVDGTAAGHVRKTTTSNTTETVFQAGGAGFIFVSAIADTSVSGVAQVTVYDNAVADANIIGKGLLAADTTQVVCASPAHFLDGVIVRAKSDGTNTVEVLISTIAANPVNNSTIISGKVSYIDAGSATTNFGNLNNAQVKNQIGNNERGLIQFDLSSLPLGFQASSATMTLTVNAASNPADSVDLYAILKTWTELGVTWNTRDGSTAWSTAGLGAGTDKSSSPKVQFTVGDVSINDTIEVDVTDLVNEWLDGSLDNNGMLLEFPNLAGSNSFVFDSDDSSTQSERPFLTVVP